MLLRSKSQGTAIFMALLMIAIVSTIAVLLMRTQQMDIRRTQMMLTSEQAYLYAQETVDWAKSALIQDQQTPQANTVWPLVLAPTKTSDGQGTIKATLQDAEALLNINNFSSTSPSPSTSKTNSASTPAQKITGNNSFIFANLLHVLNAPIDLSQLQNLTNGISAWTTPISPTTNNLMDNYDEQYSRLKPAYRAPHAPMISISELRTVMGINSAMYTSLEPYIIALPTQTTLNTAHSPPLLLQAMGIDPNTPRPNGVQKTGQYFLLRAEVFLQDEHLVLYSLLQRSPSKQNPKAVQVTMLWQSLGTE